MAEPTYHKATLLGLPTELRLQILEEAIAVRHAAPKSPSDIRNRRTRHYPHGSFLPARGNINVYVKETNDAKSAQPSLLATNRQIREETQYIVGRVSGDPYRLDIMLLGQSGLMPTWVSRPCLVRRVSKLDIRIRPFSMHQLPTRECDHDHDDRFCYEARCLSILAIRIGSILQGCWETGVLDVAFRSSSVETNGIRLINWKPSCNKWCAIFNTTITIEWASIPIKPRHLNAVHLLDWNSRLLNPFHPNMYELVLGL